MLQLKKQSKHWSQKINHHSTPTHRSIVLPTEENLPIKRLELSKILQKFASNEEHFRNTIHELENKNRELKCVATSQESSQHQIERYRHLLSIKEQLIIAQQKQIQELKSSLQKVQAKTSEGRDLQSKSMAIYTNSNNNEQDLNELSKIQCIDQYDSSQKENRGFETKRKICLKKSMKSIKNNITFKTIKGDSIAQETYKLEIARLKAEVSRLQSLVQSLHVQLQIAQIQTDHLSKESDISYKRERKLQETLVRVLRDQDVNKGQEESMLSQKCEMLERYIDKLTQKVERIDHPQLQPPPFRKISDVPPPITPHFSSGTAFIFPTSRRTPTKMQSPPHDEIFEAYCQQDYPEKE